MISYYLESLFRKRSTTLTVFMVLVIVIRLPFLTILMSQRLSTLIHIICCRQNLKNLISIVFLELFNSYLLERYQSVRINPSISSASPDTSRCAPGYSVGSVGSVTQDSKFRYFADDRKVFIHLNAQTVQDDIDSLSEWSELNNILTFTPKV